MALIQPRTVAGTLELLPREQMIFQHMLDTIRRGFERYGFVGIETPVFEIKDVLLTKSGGETEKQVYLVQSTGGLQQGHEADLALRFDLTVPLARYVAEHEHELTFPFRRYQIQRVYRGERAQRGRFREFYQCDIDVIGKDKLDPAYDAEAPAIIVQIFDELKVGNFTINFSNRKVLLGLLASYGLEDGERQKLVLREIDKIDKIGVEKVNAAITSHGLNHEQAANLLALIQHKGDKDDVLVALTALNIQHPTYAQGVLELTRTVETLRVLGVPEHRTRLNLAIARGLDYYTGTVYETLIDDHPEFGSVCSGGRYDDLASFYTKSKLPGVGISIGLTRLFDQLNANGLLVKTPHTVQILVFQLEPELRSVYLTLAADLRRAGFRVESYLEPAKFDKQLKYADKSGIPIGILLGGNEQAKGTVIVKNLLQKSQDEVPRQNLLQKLREILHDPQP